jgi:protein subunit release factor B
MITPKKWQLLLNWMAELGIKANELQEKFIKGSGKGGQKVNKTASCVYLLHLPSGIEIKCQDSRSREDNRYHARKRLCQQLDIRINGKDSQLAKEQERIRKQKQRKLRRSKNNQKNT